MKIFIGMGSNLAEPTTQIRMALTQLTQLPKTQFIRASSLYESAPLGSQDQPNFINAVAELETELTPEILLTELQKIEDRQGRVRTPIRWQARTLDLDILLYGNESISTDRIQIPHSGIKTREFVLHPLLEIAPGLRLPTGEFIQDLAQNLKSIRRVD